MKGQTLDHRFFAKVHMTSDCWLWTGARLRTGYGRFWCDGSNRAAHRVAYERYHGCVVSPELHMDHLCRNPSCVRPDHLEPVTPRENTLRSPIAPAAVNSRKTHCPQGHPYSFVCGGKRMCHECHRVSARNQYAKKRLDPEFQERNRAKAREWHARKRVSREPCKVGG